MRVGSLFSGIGGLDLGLEQAGMQTVWQVEYDDWARASLEKNFSHTKKYKDVREVGKHNLEPVDLIAGGFPCQDVSISNINGAGLDGAKSGLWFEMFRILCELRPRYALIENVSNLIFRGLNRVMSDLASEGFDAEWTTLRADEFGLPHARPRLFIVAHSAGIGLERRGIIAGGSGEAIETRAFERSGYQVVPILGNPTIMPPEHLCLDDGFSYRIPDVAAAIKGYGNAVAPPVAKWIGERILEFDCQK